MMIISSVQSADSGLNGRTDMQEIALIILLCLYPATICGAILSYSTGYIKGMKKIIDIDTEYDKKFKEMITDFVTEKYERKK